MSIRSIAGEALEALRFNRQRSVLTMISLAWGVACFVILYSYGEGFNLTLVKSFQAVGQDLILMIPGQTSSQAGGERSGRWIHLERSDVDAIREAVPLVSAVSPECMLRGASVVRGYRTESLSIRSAYANYGRIRNMVMSSGRWLSPEDDAQKQRVAVLGAEAAHKLFGEIPPEGEVITINGLRFSVAGVLRTKAQISNYNTPDNDCIFIPFDAMSLLRGVKYPDFIVWTPVNPMFRNDAIRQVRAVLARTHNFSPNDEQAVRMIAFNEFLRLIDTMSMALRVLLGFIGTLTLGIGGVGLANIMLVSVTQRTRENRRAQIHRRHAEGDSLAISAGGHGHRDGGWRVRRVGRLCGDRGTPDAASTRADVPRFDGHRRHSPAHFKFRRDDFDDHAGNSRPNSGSAAGDQSFAPRSD